jgi:[acyl-carrier-protein] S-malonyltransferase
MQREAQKHQGAMQAIVGLTLADVEQLVKEVQPHGIVAIANHNMETQIVITGAPGPVAQVGALAAAKGANAVALKVSGAWHSELIRGAEAEFTQCLGEAVFQKPHKHAVLNVTADTAEKPEDIRAVVARQLYSPVRWYDSMVRMRDAGCAVIESGREGPRDQRRSCKAIAQICNNSLAQLENSETPGQMSTRAAFFCYHRAVKSILLLLIALTAAA